MIEQILPGLFQVKLPFPGNPLRDINTYIIKYGDQALMVDNGIDQDETCEALTKGIRELEIDPAKTRFFITHGHPDHCGNTPVLANARSVIHVSKADIDMLSYGSEEREQMLREHTAGWGLANNHDLLEGSSFKSVHPMAEFAKNRGWDFNWIGDGDILEAGDFTFTCIETPGHCDGHLCLYEPDKKLLFCGDHILEDVTPIIMSLKPESNPLESYLASMDKLYKLDVRLALPAHRGIVTNVKARIDELRQHHEARLNEILDILDHQTLSACEIAKRMSWDVPCKSWEEFPIWQQMMATGEAVAHLRYLVGREAVCRDIEGKLEVYRGSN